MPMPKKFEDWTPPWKDDEFDAEKAAKLVYNLEVDKEKLGEQKATVVQERDAAVTRATTAESALSAKAQEGETAEQKAQRLEQELQQLKAQPAPGTVTPEVQQARLRAAMSIEGISAADALALAEYIQGTTEDEAKQSATAFVEKFGIPGATKESGSGSTDDDDDDDDNVGSILNQQPRGGRPRNPLDDRQGGGGEKPVSDLLDLVPRI